MAKKKKKSGKTEARNAITNIEKTHKELQLHIQDLKKHMKGATFFKNGDDDNGNDNGKGGDK